MSAIRITRGVFFADVLRVRDTSLGELWVYIVQRTGSPDVLAMGTCASREAAEKLARQMVADRAEEDGGTAAAS